MRTRISPKNKLKAFVQSHGKLMLWLAMAPVWAIHVALKHLDPETNALRLSRSLFLNDYIPMLLIWTAVIYCLEPITARSKRLLAFLSVCYLAPVAALLVLASCFPNVMPILAHVPGFMSWVLIVGLFSVVSGRAWYRRHVVTLERDILPRRKSKQQSAVLAEKAVGASVQPCIASIQVENEVTVQRTHAR